MSGDEKFGIVSKGDVVRAVRQSLADQGVDLGALARESVEGALLKKIHSLDITAITERLLREQLKEKGWELRDLIGRHVANKVSISVEVKP